jgi:hypothetical protein
VRGGGGSKEAKQTNKQKNEKEWRATSNVGNEELPAARCPAITQRTTQPPSFVKRPKEQHLHKARERERNENDRHGML